METRSTDRDAAEAMKVQGSLAELAYDRIEDLIVHLSLPPGSLLKMHELQAMVEVGRTPVHQAVRRLAAETLIEIRPRDGLRISPIDLARDRRLLDLRREMDRFVVRLAAERIAGNQLAQLRRIMSELQAQRESLQVLQFNRLDRLLDQAIITAAGERFLERTLRPLHIVFRRIGYLFLRELAPEDGLRQTINCHIDLLDGIVGRDEARAVAASDALVDLVHAMLNEMERRIDPQLLDVGLQR